MFFFLLFIFQVVKFSGFTIFEFTNQRKLPFLSKNNSKFFRLPSPCETCAFPFDFVLGRDPKNLFYYQREVENYTDQVPDFLWFDKQEYTNGILRSVILVSIFMLRVYETFPLFLRIWLTESILIFREKLFKELTSYWLLTLYVTSLRNGVLFVFVWVTWVAPLRRWRASVKSVGGLLAWVTY